MVLSAVVLDTVVLDTVVLGILVLGTLVLGTLVLDTVVLATVVLDTVVLDIMVLSISLAAQSAFFRTDRGPDQLKSSIGLARQKDTSKYPSPHQMRGNSMGTVGRYEKRHFAQLKR